MFDPTAPAPFSSSRTVRAPRALVWEVYTQPAHLMKWMGPAETTMLKADMDLRPGGVYHYGMSVGEGLEMWGMQKYLEVVPMEKLVFIQTFSDPDRGLTRHPMAPTWPSEMLAQTQFEDAGPGMTTVTVTWQPYHSDDAGNATFDAARDGMTGGFNGQWENLDRYLATLQ
jgi:uncharacterized protein YndB with AHSA1/START domain